MDAHYQINFILCEYACNIFQDWTKTIIIYFMANIYKRFDFYIVNVFVDDVNKKPGKLSTLCG